MVNITIAINTATPPTATTMMAHNGKSSSSSPPSIPAVKKINTKITITYYSSTSIQAKRTLYLTLVRSILLYCSPLWLIKDI